MMTFIIATVVVITSTVIIIM